MHNLCIVVVHNKQQIKEGGEDGRKEGGDLESVYYWAPIEATNHGCCLPSVDVANHWTLEFLF